VKAAGNPYARVAVDKARIEGPSREGLLSQIGMPISDWASLARRETTLDCSSKAHRQPLHQAPFPGIERRATLLCRKPVRPKLLMTLETVGILRGLVTLRQAGAMIIAISTVYRCGGLLFDKWLKHHGKDDPNVSRDPGAEHHLQSATRVQPAARGRDRRAARGRPRAGRR